MTTLLKLAIEGMHCGGCAARVTKALGKIEGVEVRKVEIGGAEVVYDEARVRPAELIQAVHQLGFVARES